MKNSTTYKSMREITGTWGNYEKVDSRILKLTGG